MNVNILKKCVDELNTEQPNISYIKGIIETLIEMSGSNQIRDLPPQLNKETFQPQNVVPVLKTDEELAQEDFARRYAGGPVAELS